MAHRIAGEEVEREQVKKDTELFRQEYPTELEEEYINPRSTGFRSQVGLHHGWVSPSQGAANNMRAGFLKRQK
jgi:hypothetical protein